MYLAYYSDMNFPGLDAWPPTKYLMQEIISMEFSQGYFQVNLQSLGLWRNCASFFWTQEQNLLTVLCSWDRYCSIWRHLWRASPILNSFHVLHSILDLMPLTLLSSGRAVLGWCTEKWHILWLYSLSPPTSSPNKEQTQSPSPSLCQTEPYRGFSTNPSVLGGCWLPGLLHSAFLSAVHKVRRSFGCLLYKHKENSG